jgi:hypothetical protein
MTKVRTEALREGMVAAAEVRNMDDMLLLPAGCPLTQRHIRILQTWGVPEVLVADRGAPEEEHDPLRRLGPEALARLEGEVQRRFWDLDPANPAQRELVRLTLRRQAGRLTAA